MKKNNIRKSAWILAIVMAILMVFSSVPAVAAPETQNAEDNQITVENSNVYPSMQIDSNIYPSMQNGTEVYPSMQEGSEVYPSMQGYADIYPSMQNGIDISGAVYAVTPVAKTIDDAVAIDRCGIAEEDLHFIQEWDITSDTYPLNVTFFIAGADNTTLYILSGSENGWTALNRGSGSSLTVTFTENSHAAVYVGPSLFSDFQVEDIEIIEGTCGYTLTEWIDNPDDPTGQQIEVQYFRYDPQQSQTVQAKVIYDGQEFSGTLNNIANQIEQITGQRPYFWFNSEQSYSNQWTVGNEYDVTVEFMGKTAETKVRIVKSPLEAVSVEDMTISEGAHCGLSRVNATDCFFHYSLEEVANITIKYGDDIFSGNYDAISNYIYEKTGQRLGAPQFNTNQTYDNQWKPENKYQATFTLLGVESEPFNVTITESPFVSIKVEPVTLIENADGNEVPVWQPDGTTVSYYRYNYFPKVTLTTKNGEQVTQTGNFVQSISYNGESFNVMPVDDQETNHWEQPGDYSATVYAGGLQTTVKVTVEESPIESISFNPDVITIYEGMNRIAPERQLNYTILFKDGSSMDVIGSQVEYRGKNYSLSFAYPDIQPGDRKTVTAKLLGKETELTLECLAADSIELVDNDGLKLRIHNSNGETEELTVYTIGINTPNSVKALHTDKGIFGCLFNYSTNTGEMSLSIANLGTNVLVNSNWLNTDIHASDYMALAGVSAEPILTNAEFNGLITRDNIDAINMMVYISAGFKYPDDFTQGSDEEGTYALVKASTMKSKILERFAVTSDFDMSLSSTYDSDSDTIKIRNVFSGSNTPDYVKVIANESEQGFLLHSYRYDFDLHAEFDENYKIKSINLDSDTPTYEWVTPGVDESYTGLAENLDGNWYYVKNGEKDLSFNGIASNENGNWYVKDGIVDLTYNTARYTYEDVVYKIVNGQAIALQSADYTKVDEAIAKIPESLEPYTDESRMALQDAIDSVDRTKLEDEQAEVDAMAQAIEAAIANLHVKTIDDMAAEKGTGWFQAEDQWYYAENGKVKKEWVKPGSTWYYMNPETGAMQTGIQTIKGSKYFFSDSGAMQTGWIKDGGNWYYAESSGALATGWVQVGPTWYYMDSEGVMQTGMLAINGKKYFMASSGAMQTGWIKDGGNWYYAGSSGALTTGWVQVGSTWYYMDSESVMQTGLQDIGGKRYYLAGSGAMQTGWVKAGDNWYYADGSGVIQTGWVKAGTTWYYMDSEGVMQTGWVKVGNAWYYMNASGAMQTGWVQVDTVWYYMNTSGAMQTGWIKIGSTWYYMNLSGAMQTGWVKIGTDEYYFNSSGAMQTGWVQKSNGIWYYAKSGGAMKEAYVGSVNSKIVHKQGCHYVDQISSKNLQYLTDDAATLKTNGYRSCTDCHSLD